MLKEKISIRKSSLKGLVLALILGILMPFLSFSSSEHKIYVDDDASGTQDGSSSHPYKTISEAMKHSDEDTEVHVKNGTYKENIYIASGVELYGESRDKVIIKAKDDNEPTVKMYHKSKIDKVTIQDGEDGILIDDGAKASVIDCLIKDNDRAGINIEEGEVKDKKLVSISESEIRDNGKAGIYSETRKLSLTDNTIKENGGDGIVLAKNSSAWIGGNEIKDNDKSGMKLVLDGSNIWTKSNKIKNNDREGIEVNWSGASGRINIAKSDFKNNQRFGIAKVQRYGSWGDNSLWNKYLTFDERNEFSGNGLGEISKIVIVK